MTWEWIASGALLLAAAVVVSWNPLERMLRDLKQRLMNYNERQLCAEFAKEAARQIMLNVIGPGAYCTDEYCADHIRHRQAQADAALVENMGKGRRPTGIQAGEPGCSPSVRNRRSVS